MKLVLLMGENSPVASALIKVLKENHYRYARANKADEIDQLGKQAGHVMMIFTDPAFASQFLSQNKWNGFPILSILYLNQKPDINPAQQAHLLGLNLNIIDSTETTLLIEQLNIFTESSGDSCDSLDIEFLVHTEMEEE